MTYREEAKAYLKGILHGTPLVGGLAQGWEGIKMTLMGAVLLKPTVISEENGGVNVRFRKTFDGSSATTPEEKERTAHITATQGARLRGMGAWSLGHGVASLAAAGYNLYQSGAFLIDGIHQGFHAAQTQSHEAAMLPAFLTSLAASLLTRSWLESAKQWQKPIVAELREWEALHPKRSLELPSVQATEYIDRLVSSANQQRERN